MKMIKFQEIEDLVLLTLKRHLIFVVPKFLGF